MPKKTKNNVAPITKDEYVPTTPSEVREWQAQLLLSKLGERHGSDLNDADTVANIRADALKLVQLLDDGVET